MLLLQVRNLKHYFGDRCIFDIPSLDLYTGDRVGLLGRNGVGKTTLLKVLLGEIKPDQGTVNTYGKAAYLPQLDDGIGKADAPKLKTWVRGGSVHSHMSGGERTRLKLAQVFSAQAHWIVADEPTTNLDIDGIQMLQDELTQFDGAVLLVSHDRELLDGVCNQIWELEDGKLNIYPGNYSDYYQIRQERRASQMAEYEAYVRERRHLEEAIRTQESKARSAKKAPSRMGNSEARLHKGATRARQAKIEQGSQALKSRLARLEAKEKPFESTGPNIDLQPPSPINNEIALRVEGLTKAFSGRTLLNDVSFMVRRGDKACLMGANGTGKSTLLQMIVQRDPQIEMAGSAKVGYFSQTLDILDESKTILENVEESAVHPRQFVRLVLGRLLFRGDDVHKQVTKLSGGERVKCAFAKLFLQDVNFLILDEPTNYLDIDSMEALADVLQDYAGTVLFVSHDRRFINQVANRLLIIEDQKITTFEGTYDEYQERDKAANNSAATLLLLENRLADLTGRLSMPGPDDDVAELDRQFKEVVAQIRQLKLEKTQGR